MNKNPTITPEQKQAVREWIWKAVPDTTAHRIVSQVWPYRQGGCINCSMKDVDMLEHPCRKRPILLSDVLRALIESVDKEYHPHSPELRNAYYVHHTLKLLAIWNLSAPSLEEQEDEVWLFLLQLLPKA